MSEQKQQTDMRDYDEINEAIDNINMKVLELEEKIDTVAVFYYTVMAYFSGKLTEEEVRRIKDKFENASAEDVSKFLQAFEIMQERDKEISSVVDMLEQLDAGRWNE